MSRAKSWSALLCQSFSRGSSFAAFPSPRLCLRRILPVCAAHLDALSGRGVERAECRLEFPTVPTRAIVSHFVHSSRPPLVRPSIHSSGPAASSMFNRASMRRPRIAIVLLLLALTTLVTLAATATTSAFLPPQHSPTQKQPARPHVKLDLAATEAEQDWLARPDHPHDEKQGSIQDTR